MELQNVLLAIISALVGGGIGWRMLERRLRHQDTQAEKKYSRSSYCPTRKDRQPERTDHTVPGVFEREDFSRDLPAVQRIDR